MKASWSMCSWSGFAILFLFIAVRKSSLKSVQSSEGVPAYFGVSCGQIWGVLLEKMYWLASAVSSFLAADDVRFRMWLILSSGFKLR